MLKHFRKNLTYLVEWVTRERKPLTQWLSNYRALSKRERFDEAAWLASSVEPSWARRVCAVIAESLDMPNHHYLPSDLASLYLVDDSYDFGRIELVKDLNRLTGLNITDIPELCCIFHNEDCTLEELFLLLKNESVRQAKHGNIISERR